MRTRVADLLGQTFWRSLGACRRGGEGWPGQRCKAMDGGRLSETTSRATRAIVPAPAPTLPTRRLKETCWSQPFPLTPYACRTRSKLRRTSLGLMHCSSRSRMIFRCNWPCSSPARLFTDRIAPRPTIIFDSCTRKPREYHYQGTHVEKDNSELSSRMGVLVKRLPLAAWVLRAA